MGTEQQRIYHVAGLTLGATFPLPIPEQQSGEIDVEVVLGPPTDAAYRRPSTDVVAELVVDEWPRYSFCRTADGFVGRFYGVADFEISEDLRFVTCRADKEADPGLVPILVYGSLVAFLLMARGQMVLHASAVALGSDTVAFVGPPLQGKTTLATMLCAAGGRLLADDVLPLRIDADGVEAVPASGLLRLRQGATTLLDRFPIDGAPPKTADERVAFVPPATERAPQRLTAVVLPTPMRDGNPVIASRLPSTVASFRLAQGARIEGWRRSEDLRRWLDAATQVAALVPVFEMRVPWGPPFAPGLAADILDAIGLPLPATADTPTASTAR